MAKKEKQPTSHRPKNSHSTQPKPARPRSMSLPDPQSQTHQSPPSQSIPFLTHAPHRTVPPREDQPLASHWTGRARNQPTQRTVRPKIVPLRTASRSTVGRSCPTTRTPIGRGVCEWHGFGLIFLVGILFFHRSAIQDLREASRFPSPSRSRQPGLLRGLGWSHGTNLFREERTTVYGSAV